MCVFLSFKFLMSDELGLVDAILISLTGHSYKIDDDDRQSLSPAVLKALNTADKVPEPDESCRRLLLETVRLFLWTTESAEQLKNVGAYFIIRELHKWEKSEELLLYIEDELVSKFFQDEPGAEADKAKIEVIDDEREAKGEAIEEDDGELDDEDEDTDAELERELAEYDALMAKKAEEEAKAEAARLRRLAEGGDDSDSD